MPSSSFVPSTRLYNSYQNSHSTSKTPLYDATFNNSVSLITNFSRTHAMTKFHAFFFAERYIDFSILIKKCIFLISLRCCALVSNQSISTHFLRPAKSTDFLTKFCSHDSINMVGLNVTGHSFSILTSKGYVSRCATANCIFFQP